MNSRYLRIAAVVVSIVIFSFSGFAQQEAKKMFKAASLDGTTGLFKAWDAETLRHSETNWTFGYDQVNRDPGQLTIGRAPAGVSLGLFDRFEIFFAMDVQRHITGDNIKLYRSADRLSAGRLSIPATTPTGTLPYFTQAAPFIDVPRATGRSDSHLGLKFNLLSERRGKPLSMGIAGFVTFPGQKTATGLNRGLSSGAYQAGVAWLLSKTAADFIRLHLNFGSNFYTDPAVSNVTVADLQHEFIYKVGTEFPTYKPYRVIAELSGLKYYGDQSNLGVLNPKSAVDLILGMRFYPREWISLGAGYQASLDHVKDDPASGIFGSSYHGFVVQGTIGNRRNDPPKVTCAVARQTILQADTTPIRASGVDPDGDTLKYTWTTSGGKISGSGDTATFDATGIAPGKYTITATVSDKKHQSSCTADITVLKRNHPPTLKIEPSSVTITQGESANLSAIGSDPDNDALTYTWAADGQRLAAAGPQITFGSEGRKPGTYNVTATVSDGEATADSSARVTVRERIIPNRPPTVECLTTTMDVASGSSIELRARASDPDGDKLTFGWSATGGAVSGSGESATFNASGVRAGSYTVTATVNDGRGGNASCAMTVNVSERLSVTRDKCGYFAPRSVRIDNCAKAILDDLAVRMKNDPKLRANVIGYTDGSRTEKSKKALGESRAKAVASYLEKQGVEASRLTITDGNVNNPVGDNKTAAGRTLNRRVEVELTVR